MTALVAVAAVAAVPATVVFGLVLTSWIVGRRVDALYPPSGRFIELPSGRVHYVDLGAGPPIVFIHGLGGSLGNYSHSLLGALADDFRVLAIDRAGSGHTPRQGDAGARLPRQAALVVEFIAALKLERPLLVGHSLGGAIALRTALDHPEAVAGLALLAPLTAPDIDVPAVYRRLGLARPLVRRVLAWTVAVPLFLAFRQQTLHSVFAPDPPPADFGSRGGGWLSCRPAAVYAASADMVAIPDDLAAQAARYGELRLPVGILFGTADRVLDHRQHGAAMAQHLPQLDFEPVPSMGHMAPVSHPDRCAAFIQRVAAGAMAERAA